MSSREPSRLFPTAACWLRRSAQALEHQGLGRILPVPNSAWGFGVAGIRRGVSLQMWYECVRTSGSQLCLAAPIRQRGRLLAMNNSVEQLKAHGQVVWLDSIHREMITSGHLSHL